MTELRQKLQAMTQVDDVSQHPALLDAVSRECPNTIKLLVSSHPVELYTCLVHALGFVNRPEYTAIAARGFNKVFAGRAFVQWLLDRSLLAEVAQVDARERDLVLYFNDVGQFQHAGLVAGDHRVVSKWGTGLLFEHGLFEVPESYGTSVRFFKNLPYDDACDHFMTFARENGMLF
jgi:hypothetical protein